MVESGNLADRHHVHVPHELTGQAVGKVMLARSPVPSRLGVHANLSESGAVRPSYHARRPLSV